MVCLILFVIVNLLESDEIPIEISSSDEEADDEADDDHGNGDNAVARSQSETNPPSMSKQSEQSEHFLPLISINRFSSIKQHFDLNIYFCS